MKKYIIQAALVLGSAFFLPANGTAQVTSELRDFYNNGVVTNDTLEFWINLGDAHAYFINQYNISAGPVTYKVRKTNVQIQNGAQSNFCMYHNNDASDPQSQCYIPTVTLSGTFATDSGEFNTLLPDFNAGTLSVGTSIIRYAFFDISNPNDSVTITFIYNVTPVGITESSQVKMSEPYPNPATSVVTVDYSLANSNSGNAIVRDLQGNEVFTHAISASAGRIVIETSDWASGVYILSVMDENGVAAKRKIIVE